MKIVLETQRLLLREFIRSDAESLMRMESEPDFLRYVGRSPLADIDAYRRKIESLLLPLAIKRVGYGAWAVLENVSGEFIGACSLSPGYDAPFAADLQYDPDDVEIGYGLCKPFWGKGYATEVVKAMTQRAFTLLGASSVVASVMVENRASIRVLTKTGFRKAGEPICLSGEEEHSVKYAITKRQFNNQTV